MKMRIETQAKTIKIEGTEKLTIVWDSIRKLFPNDQWKEYSLEANTTIQWYSYPVITYPYLERERWVQPWYCKSTNDSIPTVFNIDIT